MPPSKDTSVSGTIHSHLSTHGLKESEATGGEKQYHEGYCDALESLSKKRKYYRKISLIGTITTSKDVNFAKNHFFGQTLEWVLNHVLPNGEGVGHVDGGTVPGSGGGSGRREYIKMGKLFPQIGRQRCRVCMERVQPPKQVYCSDYCSTIASNVKQLYSWPFISQYVANRDGECVKCGSASEYSIDHIIPHPKGGHPFDPDNLQRLCEDCHNEKGLSETDYRDEGSGGVRLFPDNSVGQLTMDSFENDVDAITQNTDQADTPGEDN